MKEAKKEKLYNLQEATAEVGRQCGKNIGTGFVSECLHALMPGHPDFSVNTCFTVKQILLIGMYAGDVYHTKNRTSILDWISQHNFSTPKPYEPPVPVVIQSNTGKKQKQAVIPGMKAEDLQRIIRTITKQEIEKTVKGLSLPAREIQQITDGTDRVTRDNDPLVLDVHNKINAFIFNEPVTAPEVWTTMQSKFELRNGIKVLRQHGQSFPQWLRSEGYLEIFHQQLQGFLDDLHDTLHGPGNNGKGSDKGKQPVLAL